jgi:hypothetical protein
MSQTRDATYSIPVFHQDMVVTTDGNEEKYDLYVIKDMDPLLPLGPLAAHIEHAVCEVSELEYCFCDTSRP